MPLGYIDFKWVLRSVLRGPWLCAYDMCLCVFCREKLKFAFDSERKCNWEKQEPATWELNGVREHDNMWTGRTNGTQLSPPSLCVCAHACTCPRTCPQAMENRQSEWRAVILKSIALHNKYVWEWEGFKIFQKKKIEPSPKLPQLSTDLAKMGGEHQFLKHCRGWSEELWGPSSC